jgi:hypothetical protein
MRTLLVLIALLLAPAVAFAEGVVVKKSTCLLTAVAPQSSEDGSNLADLKEYRIYVAATPAELPPPTGPTTMVPIAVVPAPELDPPAGRILTWPCTALALGQWWVTASAVDTSGNEGARAAFVPFVSSPDPDVVPPSAPSAPVVTGP